jgi:hypothetical protein
MHGMGIVLLSAERSLASRCKVSDNLWVLRSVPHLARLLALCVVSVGVGACADGVEAASRSPVTVAPQVVLSDLGYLNRLGIEVDEVTAVADSVVIESGAEQQVVASSSDPMLFVASRAGAPLRWLVPTDQVSTVEVTFGPASGAPSMMGGHALVLRGTIAASNESDAPEVSEGDPDPAPADTMEGDPDPAPADTMEGDPDPAPADTMEGDPDPAPADEADEDDQGDTSEGDPDPAPADTMESDPDPAPADEGGVKEGDPDPAPAMGDTAPSARKEKRTQARMGRRSAPAPAGVPGRKAFVLRVAAPFAFSFEVEASGEVQPLLLQLSGRSLLSDDVLTRLHSSMPSASGLLEVNGVVSAAELHTAHREVGAPGGGQPPRDGDQ